MAKITDVRKEVENWLAADFPQIYLEYFKSQQNDDGKSKEMKQIEQELFEIFIKAIDNYMAENCREIVVEEIREFLQSSKFKKLILSMLVDNSKSTGG